MDNVVVCPNCGHISLSAKDLLDKCLNCHKATMVYTNYTENDMPDMLDVGFGEYYAFCRKIFTTIIEPMGQLDKTSLEFHENYSRYFEIDLKEPYLSLHKAKEAESLAKATAEIARDKRLTFESQKPKCPTCGSTNLHSIGGLERAGSVAMLGLFSKKINKSFKCNQCGYTW